MKKIIILLMSPMVFIIKKVLKVFLDGNRYEIIRSKYSKAIKEKKFIIFKPKKYIAERFEKGVNMVGLFTLAAGVGVSSRIVSRILSNTKYKFSLFDHEIKNANIIQEPFDLVIENEFKYSINLIHLNPYNFKDLIKTLPRDNIHHHYNIFFWLWELENFPNIWLKYLQMANEIWVPSKFIKESLQKFTNKKVTYIPYYLDFSPNPSMDREYFGLPKDKKLVLIMYDQKSIPKRKNPEGAINAFKQAFKPYDNQVALMIKVNHATDEVMEELRNLIGEGYETYYFKDVLSKEEVNGLINSCDIYLSLYRSEGFGLILTEAMLMNKVVVATNWSAPSEFLNINSSCPVNYKLVELDKNYGPYEVGNYWAEPDLNHASEYLKKLIEDEEYYKALSQNASKTINKMYNLKQSVQIMENRINSIYQEIE